MKLVTGYSLLVEGLWSTFPFSFGLFFEIRVSIFEFTVGVRRPLSLGGFRSLGSALECGKPSSLGT